MTPRANALRMTAELADIIDRTADHIGQNEADVVRACSNGFFHGRSVIHCKISETYYKSGPIVRTYRCRLPEDKDKFRKTIALRCMEELQKPKYEEFVPPKNVRYILEDDNADSDFPSCAEIESVVAILKDNKR